MKNSPMGKSTLPPLVMGSFEWTPPPEEYEKDDKVGPFISDLLSFQGQLHRFHLNTRSHARHIALDEAYKGLPEKVDQLAESYLSSGREMKIFEFTCEEFDTPEELLNHVKDYANSLDIKCRCINNALDELTMFVSGILYKLQMH